MYFIKKHRYLTASLAKDKFAPAFTPAIDWLLGWKDKKSNLAIFGSVGTGKTYLINAFLNDLADKGTPAPKKEWGVYIADDIVYCTLKDIIDNIRKSWGKNSEEDWQKSPVEYYKTCDLLIIDEVGVNYGSDSERIELYEIFNYRWEMMKPIVYLGNKGAEPIESTLGKLLGQRISDRILDGALVIETMWESKRTTKFI
jgi:DNA replication protein DnaC